MAVRTVKSTGATIRPNIQALNKLLKDRNGPVVLHVANVGRQAVAECKRLAPRGSGYSGSGRAKPGKRIADAIEGDLVQVGGRWVFRITIDAEHAMPVLMGAKRHDIPQSPGHLSFYWEREQVWFKGPSVSHPGTQPYNFVEDAFNNIGLRSNKPVNRL